MLPVQKMYAQADSIDVFLKKQMQERKIPGLQLAIVRNGQIVKKGNYGVANLQDSIPVDSRTMFTINFNYKSIYRDCYNAIGRSRETKVICSCIFLS